MDCRISVQCDWTWSLIQTSIYLVKESSNKCPTGLWTWHLRCRGNRYLLIRLSNLLCSATEHCPILKPLFFLSMDLYISAAQDLERDNCVVGASNMQFWPHILEESPTFGQNWSENRWSNSLCSATERGPWLKPPIILSKDLHVISPQDCEHDTCVVGARNGRFWSHILGEFPTFGSKIDLKIACRICCSANERGPWLKPQFILSKGLHISAPRDFECNNSVVGVRNMQFWPHILG